MQDAVAIEILDQNMAFVAEKVDTALGILAASANCPKISVMFSGGISKKSDILFPLIKKHITRDGYILVRLENEPVDGAVKRAKKIYETKMQGEKV